MPCISAVKLFQVLNAAIRKVTVNLALSSPTDPIHLYQLPCCLMRKFTLALFSVNVRNEMPHGKVTSALI